MKNLKFLIFSILFLVCFLLLNLGCDDDDECGNSFCVGAIFPETGDAANAGPILKAGLQLAMSDVNDAGGNIKIIFRDSAGVPETADVAAEELLDMGVHGIVGAYASGVSQGFIRRVTRDNRVVMISPSNTSPSFTEYNEGFLDVFQEEDFPYYYRTASSDVHRVRLMIDRIKTELSSVDPIKIAMVYRTDDWGTRLSKLIENTIERDAKLKLIGTVSYSREQAIAITSGANSITAVDTIITEVNAIEDEDSNSITSADAILLITFDEGTNILKGMIDSGSIPNPDMVRYYMGLYISRSILAEGVCGNSGSNTMCSDINGIEAFTLTSNPSKRMAFEQRLRERNSSDLPDALNFASETYDAVILLALASLSADSNEPTEYVSQMIDISKDGKICSNYSECRMLLMNDDNIDYNGISGDIDFDGLGDITKSFYDIVTYTSTDETRSTYSLTVDENGDSSFTVVP